MNEEGATHGQTENPNNESVEAVLQLAVREEEQLAHRANWLDTKTAAVLGFVIVAVAELLGFLFLASAEKSKFQTVHTCLLGLVFFSGLGALLVASLVGLAELRPMGFKFGAGAELLAPHVDEEPTKVRLLALDSLRGTISGNRRIVDKKASLTKVTVLFVAIALLLFAAAVTILFLSLF